MGEAPQTALRKMAAADGAGQDRSPDRLLWAQASPRAFDAALGIEAALSALSVDEIAADRIAQSADETGVILRIVTPAGRPAGLVHLDAALLGVVIEWTILGRLSPRPGQARAGTAVDAVLAQPLAETLLGAGGLLSLPDAGVLTVRGHWTDPRAAQLALDTGRFARHRFGFALGGGTRSGGLTVLRSVAIQGGTAEPGGFGRKILKSAAPAEVALDAVLHRARLPLARIRTLAVGDTIEIPREALSDVDLVSVLGERISKARLGQTQGYRAVRICNAPDEDDADLALTGSALAPAAVDLPRIEADIPADPRPGPVETQADVSDALPDLPDLPD